MTTRVKSRERTIAAWTTLVVVLAGGLWLFDRLSANRPGDAGPVVGPGAAEKVQYGFVAGAVVVVAGVVIGLAVGHLVTAFTRFRQQQGQRHPLA